MKKFLPVRKKREEIKERVLLVVNTFGLFNEINGVYNTYKNLLNEFHKTKTDIDILTYGPKDDIIKHDTGLIVSHKCRMPQKISDQLEVDIAPLPVKFSRYFNNQDYTIIHTAAPDPYLAYFAIFFAKMKKLPLLSVYHTAISHYAEERLKNNFTKIFGEDIASTIGFVSKNLLKGYEGLYFNASDLILAPSRFILKEIKKEFTTPVRILARGINTELFNPSFRKRSKTDKEIRALYIGRVDPEKNMQLLEKIFNKHKNIKLTVVGTGEYLEEMKKKLPDSRFTGKLRGKDLSVEYADADIFVFPSLTDTFGNVVLEALSSGVPAVVMNKMGPKDIVINKKCGFIAKNEKQFEKFIISLARSKKLRNKMAVNAVLRAKEFQWSNIFTKLIKNYRLARNLYNKKKKI